jgi:hypothetical protein
MTATGAGIVDGAEVGRDEEHARRYGDAHCQQTQRFLQ